MIEIVDFLTRLRAHNDRAWFADHKAEYQALSERFAEFVAELVDRIAAFDPSVAGLRVRDCTYRIYRDIRFTTDKSPFKTWMGAYVCRGGKKSEYGGYYFHLEPFESGGGPQLTESGCGPQLGAGLYAPSADVLRSVREAIWLEGERFDEILREAADFTLSRSGAMRRLPAGYAAGSPWDDYLRLRDFFVYRPVDAEFLAAPDLARRVAEAFAATRAWVEWLNRSVEYAREKRR